MKKRDVVKALGERFAAVHVERADSHRDVTLYVANVLDIGDGDVATRKNVIFYVLAEGTENEVAYWHGGDPTGQAKPNEFLVALEVYLGQLVKAGEIEAARVESSDPKHGYAVVLAYVADGDNVTATRYYVDRPGGKWRKRRLV